MQALLGAVLATCMFAAPAYAADFPNKRITIVSPYAAGGSADAISRIYAENLKDRVGQPVLVENKPGAGGYIGIESVARSTPDGYTMGVVSQQFATPKKMVLSPTFDPKDMALLGRVAAAYFIITTTPEVPARNLKDFIAYAKANPGKVSYGTVPASLMQLSMARFSLDLNADMLEVPFNGAAPIAQALLGNVVQMSFMGPTVLSQIRAGKLVGLAVATTSKSRWSVLPDIPTTAEQGLDFESGYWFGFGVPAGTPKEVFDYLARELAETAKVPSLKERILKLGMEPMSPSPAEISAYVKNELEANISVANKLDTPK